MTPTETVQLVAIVAGMCPAMRMEESTPDAWHLVLGHLDANDARQAVVSLGRREKWIAPADIVAEVKAIRDDRIERGRPKLEAPPADARDYTREFHRRISELASGRDVDRLLALPPAGNGCPPELRDSDAPKRVAALEVRCPWCHAGRGEHCIVPATGKRLATAGAHDIRVRLANGEDITKDLPKHDPAEPPPTPPTTKEHP